MVVISKSMGSNRDIPQIETFYQGSATAGTGTDYEHPMLAIPDLTKMLLPVGGSGDLPQNALYLRSILLITEAAITGAATNNMLLGVRQYRGGSLLPVVNTTCASAITVGVNTLTPASMQYIGVNDVLFVSAGTGTAEYVQVTAVTATTFTATFANTHSGAYTIVCNYLCSIWFNAAGVTATAWVPLQAASTGTFTNVNPNAFKAGDVLTIQRLSFGTGLASPNFTCLMEWTSLGGPITAPISRG